MIRMLGDFFNYHNLNRTLLSLVKSLKEAVLTRSLKLKFSTGKRRLRRAIHNVSYRIQDLSLKRVLKESFNNKKQGMMLTFGIAKRNATRSRYRSALLILGILLTVALETGIVISVDTLYDDFIFDNRNQNYTDITITPRNWIPLPELQTLVRNVQSVSGVAKASSTYILRINQAFGAQFSSSNILIIGINSQTHPDFPTMDLTEGRRKVSGNTVIISEQLQRDSGLQVGDIINLADASSEYGLSPRQLVIGGVLSDSYFFGNNVGYFFVLVDIDTIYEIVPDTQKPDLLKTRIDVSVSNLLNIKKTNENIKDKIGLDFYVWIEKDISDISASGIRAYQTAMNLLILTSFVVEFLFITNVLAIAIKDRSKEFGILRAIGTDSRQIVGAVTMEILIYSIIGSIVGLFVGIGFATLLVWVMQLFYETLEFQALSLHLSSLFATFLSGIIVALIAGLYPIFLALSMPVVQNIHSCIRTGKSSTQNVAYWKYNIGLGVLLAITGFSLQFFIGPSRFLDFEILSVHFLVVVFIFLGTLLVEIGILVFLPKIGLKILFWFGIITRTISMRNIAREFQKSLFTIITSALALTFIIVVGLVSVAVISGVPGYFQNQWGVIDVVAECWDDDLPSITLVSSLDHNRYVVRSSFIQEARTKIEDVDGYVYGVDPERYSYFSESIIDSSPDFENSSIYSLKQSLPNHNTSGTYCLVTDLLFQKLFKQLGSNVTFKIADNSTVNVTVSAVIKSNVFLGNGEYLYISTTRFQEFFNSTLAKWFICDIDGEAERGQISVSGVFNFKDVFAVDYYAAAIEKSLVFHSAIFQVLFIESFILAAIAQFICILISTLRMERDMGIMRSMGLHKQGVLGIFLAESTVLGFSALIVGLIDGLLGSILLAWYISLSIPIEIVFPLDRIVLWISASFLITLASTYLPSYRSSQKNIVATISGRPMSKQYVEYDEPTFPQAVIKKDVSYSPTPLWRFIIDRRLQILTAFLFLMTIFTVNYIIDGYLIIRGLIPYDAIWRYAQDPSFMLNNGSSFLLFNPLLFFTGLISIGSISYYLFHKTPPRNLSKELINSLISGFIGIIIMIILQFILMFFLSGLILPMMEQPDYYDFGVFYILFIFSYLIVYGISVLLFQKVWCYLIFRGLFSNTTFGEKVTWVWKASFEGQLRFIGLLIIHIIIQAYLFVVIHPIPVITYGEFGPEFPPVHPLSFLILTSIEIGFFLLLIIYPLVQFLNQRDLIAEFWGRKTLKSL